MNRILTKTEELQMMQGIENLESSLMEWDYNLFPILHAIKKFPIVKELRLQVRDEPDRAWVDDNNTIEEPSGTRLIIKMDRAWKFPFIQDEDGTSFKQSLKDERIWKHKFWACLNTIAMDFGQDIIPCLETSCPMDEWTDDYLTYYISWYNSYGS